MLDNSAELSPYEGIHPDSWLDKTRELVDAHPLGPDDLVDVVMRTWSDIFVSQLGSRPFRIGEHIFPSPQIMAFLLHELIPLEISAMHPGVWRGEESAEDKDLVYIPDDLYSVEIKASSSARSIFGNRSYAQGSQRAKKSKSGYYLAINFEKFGVGVGSPGIKRIRFGWLDHEDWFGQRAATGQQARLSRQADRYKMLVLYE